VIIKGYAECKRLNVSFIFSSNEHQFVEFDRFTGPTSAPKPTTEFPSPADLRARYERASPTGLTPQTWYTVRDFWTRYFWFLEPIWSHTRENVTSFGNWATFFNTPIQRIFSAIRNKLINFSKSVSDCFNREYQRIAAGCS
jgi:hypothetical protein